MIKIYLSGPMDEVSDAEGRGWRGQAKIALDEFEMEGVNPYDFEQERAIPTALVRADLRHILSCNGMIVNASQHVCTWGTPMEVLWAHMHHLLIVAFTGGAPISPWLSAHAHTIPTLEKAVEIIRWQTIRL